MSATAEEPRFWRLSVPLLGGWIGSYEIVGESIRASIVGAPEQARVYIDPPNEHLDEISRRIFPVEKVEATYAEWVDQPYGVEPQRHGGHGALPIASPERVHASRARRDPAQSVSHGDAEHTEKMKTLREILVERKSDEELARAAKNARRSCGIWTAEELEWAKRCGQRLSEEWQKDTIHRASWIEQDWKLNA